MLSAYTNIQAVYPDATVDAAVSRQCHTRCFGVGTSQKWAVHNTKVMSLGTKWGIG